MRPYSFLFSMRRFLASSALAALTFQPLAAFAESSLAIATTPTELFRTIQADTSARSISAEAHLHAENAWFSLWMSGAGEGGPDIRSAKGEMKATVDVDMPEENVKARLKFQFRVVNGVGYVMLDSLEGKYEDDVAKAVASASLKKWIAIDMPEEEFDHELDQSANHFDEILDITSAVTGNDIRYTLNLRRDFLEMFEEEGRANLTMNIRMNPVERFQSLTLEGTFASSDVSGSLKATSSKLPNGLTVTVPADTIALDEWMDNVPTFAPDFGTPWEEEESWEYPTEPTYPESEEPAEPVRPSGINRPSRRLLRQQVEAERAEHNRTRPVLSPKTSANTDSIAADGLTWGSKDAPMTIVEFGDYECPFCRLHFTNTLPDIVKNYVETGKIRYVFRNYPLSSIHDHALDAAVAVQCALEQGNEKGIELHDLVYTADMDATASNLETWAKTVEGLNLTTWKACTQGDDALDAIDADMAAADALGLTGVPFFLIIAPDGSTEVVLGSQPYDVFNEAIEILLTR